MCYGIFEKLARLFQIYKSVAQQDEQVYVALSVQTTTKETIGHISRVTGILQDLLEIALVFGSSHLLVEALLDDG